MSQECPHCPDGHENPLRRPWAVWVRPDLDGDGQPTMLTISKTGGHHVSESDALWVRNLIRVAQGIRPHEAWEDQ